MSTQYDFNTLILNGATLPAILPIVMPMFVFVFFLLFLVLFLCVCSFCFNFFESWKWLCQSHTRRIAPSIYVWFYLREKTKIEAKCVEMGTIQSTNKLRCSIRKCSAYIFLFIILFLECPVNFQTSYHNHGCATLVKRKRQTFSERWNNFEPSLNLLFLLLW